MSQFNENNNTNSDHNITKIFVGGLAWRTTSDDLRKFFGQFGEILDTNVVYESYPSRKSKGYGFVVFKDAETAAKVCENEIYVIDGRDANVNLAYLRAKNKNNQSFNQNGSVHQMRTSHQYQNGSSNQARPWHQYQSIPHPYPSPIPYYYDPYSGQYYPYSRMYQAQNQNHHYPPTMVNNYFGSTYQTQHNLNRLGMPRSRPVIVSTPRKSSRRHEINQEGEVSVDVAHHENNIEAVTTTPDNNLDRQEANDQEAQGDINQF